MQLTLIRHGEAAPGDDVPDHDRPLTAAGQRQARALGSWLAGQGGPPSLVHCSSARRVLETVDAMRGALPVAACKEPSPDLYLASAGQLLELVRATPAANTSLWIVGHNPGVAELALRLAGDGDASARRRMASGFPPAACARLSFADTPWSAVAPGAGVLDDYWTP